MVSNSPHPLSARGAEPVTDIVNAGATFFRSTVDTTAGFELVAANPGRRQGVYIKNENTDSAHGLRISTSQADYTAGNWTVVYPQTPTSFASPSVFVYGNGAIWAIGVGAGITASGYEV